MNDDRARMFRRVTHPIAVAVAALLLAPPAAAGLLDRLCHLGLGLVCADRSQTECGMLAAVAEFGDNPGRLDMCIHVPPGLAAGRPLVVALHGCGQRAEVYGHGASWTRLADEYRFALLLPQQRRANNPARCFNWFRPEAVRRHDTAGAAGEAASIWAMVQRMHAEFATDPAQVYVTGLSAGGAMTAALLAAYPEVFQGAAIIAGVPAGCAEGLRDAVRCMQSGSDLLPEEWGRRARAAALGHRAAAGAPKVAIWHGLADTTVHPMNADELIDQWTDVIGIDRTPDMVATVDGAGYQGFADASGTIRVGAFRVPAMAHGVAIDPARGCGVTSRHVLDEGICSSRRILQFWGLTPD